MVEQVGLMGFPRVYDAKAAVNATMNTYTQVFNRGQARSYRDRGVIRTGE
jgi:hypothetical protein